MKLNNYTLRKLSIYVRRRDQLILAPRASTVGRWPCWLCHGWFPSWAVSCHHIYPKSLFPDIAYDIVNGISLCQRCHKPICHYGRSAWKALVLPFRRYTMIGAAREYAEENQWRVAA